VLRHSAIETRGFYELFHALLMSPFDDRTDCGVRWFELPECRGLKLGHMSFSC
jgi:hypothetical protein